VGLHAEEEALRHFKFLCAAEDSFSKQKTKEGWLKVGDQNGVFLYVSIAHKRYNSSVTGLVERDGMLVTDKDGIGNCSR